MRFEEPSVQFDTGAAVVKDSFKAILNSFFLRYIKILRSLKYTEAIEEVRYPIGHTPSHVEKTLRQSKAYYENMRLSQDRARAVLNYVFAIPTIRDSMIILRWDFLPGNRQTDCPLQGVSYRQMGPRTLSVRSESRVPGAYRCRQTNSRKFSGALSQLKFSISNETWQHNDAAESDERRTPTVLASTTI